MTGEKESLAPCCPGPNAQSQAPAHHSRVPQRPGGRLPALLHDRLFLNPAQSSLCLPLPLKLLWLKAK